ncbi:hypothetical protein DNU06_09440 [Putridiphycobacter roseus]|uniref:Uncharacterized protein n=1 Tax=Putridiphycobacter roseus TaxID=2219161 RepID=A0A2W1MZW5_9FLAO|nr:hypothetical protein [Putridiphycobacter roseus]PZE16964.1 hypothetical protein DNU06_09440 [Putridiphycobacter roseus]
MKNLGFLLLSVMVGTFAQAQTQDPDQNPNYAQAAAKYDTNKENLLVNQGLTIQNTYEAFDWSTYKADKKQARIDNRHAVRLARANTPNYYGRPYYRNGRNYYNNYGYQSNFYAPSLGGVLLGVGLDHLLFH